MLFKKKRKKLNNKGFSLVELLVAMAIASVVAGSIGYLLVTSLRMYNNEVTDVSLQQELQMTLNQVMDYAMESEAVVTGPAPSGSDYFVLGNIEVDDTGKQTLSAKIFWVQDTSLYMKKVPLEYDDNIASRVENEITSAQSNLTQCLLADYISVVTVSVNGADAVTKTYKNPISIDITLKFTKDGSSGPMYKAVSDTATFRNRVNVPLYLNGAGGVEKYVKSSDSVTISTETVQMDKNAGYIKTEQIGELAPKQDLHILEIVSDYTYDYAQYVLGGRNGEHLNTVNTDYGSSAPFSPVTSDELEGFIFRRTGKIATGNPYYPWEYTNPENGWLRSNYYPNLNASIEAMVFEGFSERTGYFEYVGEEKGMYAINTYTADDYPKPTHKGVGNAKPNIISFSTNNGFDSDSKKFTTRNYAPEFEYRSSDDGSGEYYRAISSSGRRDYNLVTNGDISYFEYVGNDNGSHSVVFEKVNQSGRSNYYYDYGSKEYSAIYKIKGNIDSYYVENGGDYYAYINGWQTRYDGSSYTEGYDYNKNIQTVSMYSKYSSNNPAQGKNYGWVWREADKDSQTYRDIIDDKLYSAEGIITQKDYRLATSNTAPTRIYLKDNYIEKMINNEVFVMSSLQDVMEMYVDNGTGRVNIRNGIWDKSTNAYDAVNYKALKAWQDAGHKVSLSVRTPGDLSTTDINNCDMILVGDPLGDGGYGWAHNATSAIKGLPMNGDKAVNHTYFSQSNDITFEQAMLIYKKVIDYKAAIACPTAMIGYGGDGTTGTTTAGSSNLSRLYLMLYCCANDDVDIDSIKDETYRNAKKEKIEKQGETTNYWSLYPDYQRDIDAQVTVCGSGREMFSDYIKSLSADCLSANLYEDASLGTKTTDVAYIDETSGKIIYPTKSNVTHDGKNLNYPGFDIPAWGRNFNTAFFNINENSKFLTDRYAGRPDGYSKPTYTLNSSYGHEYKFYYAEPSKGMIYKNQMVYNNDSSLLTYNAGGRTGLVALALAKHNSNLFEQPVSEKKIGTIEIVGAGVRTVGDTSLSYEKSGTKYQIRPEKRLGGGDSVVFYISENELIEARKNGLAIYCVVKTGEEISYDERDPYPGSRQQNNALWYSRNEEYRTRYDDESAADTFDWLYSSNLTSEATKYAEGEGTNEKIVREYTYFMDHFYFDNFFDPNNDVFRDDVPAKNVPNNRIKAIIKAESADGTKYKGEADFIFIVRDGFDLD